MKFTYLNLWKEKSTDWLKYQRRAEITEGSNEKFGT